MKAHTMTMIRNSSFSLLGLILLSYAIAVLVTGRPDPVSPIIPSAAGFLTAIIVTVAARMGQGNAASITWDELTRSEWNKSLKSAYWVAVWLYAPFGLMLYFDLVTFSQAFAAMGTLTGAAPFLVFMKSWIQGRI